MFILTQDRKKIINAERVNGIFISDNQIFADDTLLGSYTGEIRTSGVLILVKKALCQNCMVNTYKGSYTEEDFCFDMPPDSIELDEKINQNDYLQKIKESDKRWKAFVMTTNETLVEK